MRDSFKPFGSFVRGAAFLGTLGLSEVAIAIGEGLSEDEESEDKPRLNPEKENNK